MNEEEIYYHTTDNIGKINENILNANIKLVDENKELKETINKAIEYIEEQPYEVGCYDEKNKVFYKLDLLKILKGAVE